MRQSLLLVLLSLLATAELISATTSLDIRVTGGTVRGFTAGGVDRWLGIPYAAPPIGQLRFAKPHPVLPWADIRDGSQAGNMCMQQTIPGFPGSGASATGWLGSEDCLFLNVFAPSNRSSTSGTGSAPLMPVYAWIHGGGFVEGSSLTAPPSLQNIALAFDAIVVSFNYRLGPLGFLSVPGFVQENDDGTAGNFGLLDQIQALKWIQENIAVFGGDPNAVTLGGQSAGAMSECVHMSSPLSRGLFRSTILQSGNCDAPFLFSPMPEAFAWGRTLAAGVGCNSFDTNSKDQLACLRSVDAGSITTLQGVTKLLFDTNSQVQGPIAATAAIQALGFTPYRPIFYPSMATAIVIDGVLLSATPLELFQKGINNNAGASIAGSNEREVGTMASVFLPMVFDTPAADGLSLTVRWSDVTRALQHFFGPDTTTTESILNQYPAKQYSNATFQLEHILTDALFHCPTLRAVRTLAAQLNANVRHYIYRFNGSNHDEVPAHGAEVPLVFRLVVPPANPHPTSEVLAMSNEFGQAWSSMMHTGSTPNAKSQTLGQLQQEWPQYQLSSHKSFVFDVNPYVIDDADKPNCAFWDSMPSWRPAVGDGTSYYGGSSSSTGDFGSSSTQLEVPSSSASSNAGNVVAIVLFILVACVIFGFLCRRVVLHLRAKQRRKLEQISPSVNEVESNGTLSLPEAEVDSQA